MDTAGGLRISLRQLLLLVVLFSLGCLALKYANSTWQAVFSTVVLFSFMVGAIVALIGRGIEQSFAIGFVACVLIYVAVVHSTDRSEFDPYSGTLLTSKVMNPIYQQLATQVTIDFSTGEVVDGENATIPAPELSTESGWSAYPVPPLTSYPSSQPAVSPVPAPITGGTMGGGAVGLPNMIGNAELPDRYAFMSIAHSLWALLLGCAGGMFGRAVYARRTHRV